MKKVAIWGLIIGVVAIQAHPTPVQALEKKADEVVVTTTLEPVR